MTEIPVSPHNILIKKCKTKRSCVWLFIGVGIRLIFLILLFIVLSLSVLLFRLTQGDIDLSFADSFIQKQLTLNDVHIEIQNPAIGLQNDSIFKPRIMAKKLSIQSLIKKENNYVFDDVAVAFHLPSLLQLKIRPSYIHAEKSNFVYLSSDEKSDFSFTTFYQDNFADGVLSRLKYLTVFHNTLSLRDISPEIPDISIKDSRIDIDHDYTEKQLNVTFDGFITTPYFAQNAQIQAGYTPHNNDVTLSFRAKNLKTTGGNPLGFSGTADIDAYVTLRNMNELQNANIILDAKKSVLKLADKSLPDINIKRLVMNGHYDINTKNILLNVEKLETTDGNMNLFLRADSKKTDIFDVAVTGDITNFNYNKIFANPIHIDKIDLSAQLDISKKSAHIEKLSMNANDAVISAKAGIIQNSDAENDISMDIDLNIDKLTDKNLLELWAVKLPGTARSWLDYNMVSSEFGTAVFKIKHNLTQDFPEIHASLPIKKGSFYYRKPMSPMENVMGEVILENKNLTARIDSGTINNVTIKKGSFIIPDINAPVPQGKAYLDLSGNMSDLAAVLDQDPLHIFTPKNITYQGKSGTFTGIVNMSLPLLSNVTFDDVAVSGKLDVKNAAVDLQKNRYKISDFNGNIDFTQDGLSSKFTAAVNDVKTQGTWSEDFRSSSKINTIVKAVGVINEQKLKNFDIDITDYMMGDAKTDFELNLKSGRVTKMSAILDATQAKLTIPYSVYEDKIGAKKTIKINAYDTNDSFIIKDIDIKSEKIDAHLTDMVIKNGTLQSFDIAGANAKNIFKNLSAKYIKYGNNPKFTINADTIIADDFLNYDAPLPESDKAVTPEFSRMNISVTADNVVMSPEKTLKNVVFQAESPNDTPRKMNITGHINKSGDIKIALENTAYNTKSFTLLSDDAGAFLNAYDSFYYYRSGKLNVTGTIVKTAMGVPSTISGHAEIIDGRLIDAPVVARIFSLASLTGIVDRLNSDGLTIDKIKADFVKIGENVTLKKGVVSGSAIGFSFSGDYNSMTGLCKIKGTLVPIYEINSFISNVPLIGDILTSREGEGVFGMTYRFTGTADKPDISVNPLSALTPGILRRIFD